MNIDRHTFPTGGWQFRQPQTGWAAPTPMSSTFDQTVHLIIAMRKKNPAITSKHSLATSYEAVASELERFTRKRLGLSEEATPVPFPVSRSQPRAGAAVAAGAAGGSHNIVRPGVPNQSPPQAITNRNISVSEGIRRAAQGTAVVLDWLTSGGAPVKPEIAFKRAEVCVACQFNVEGSWYTVAPAELIRDTLEARSDLKLETPHDATLKSCHICRCLNRLKVWCPIEHILKQTKPSIMAEFPDSCWIKRRI